jgi:hypothetical protein
MVDSGIADRLNELSKIVGELRGEVRLILSKLDSMEKKYNGYVEKTIRVEEKFAEIKKVLNDHLHEHRQESGMRTKLWITIVGAVSGSASAFLFTLLLKVLSI